MQYGIQQEEAIFCSDSRNGSRISGKKYRKPFRVSGTQ